MLILSVLESARNNYLIGSSMGRRLCELKIVNDVAKIDLAFSQLPIAKSILKEATTLLDKVGTVGEQLFAFSL